MSTANGHDLVRDAITSALAKAAAANGWTLDPAAALVEVERPKDRTHGDYASGIAMRLARSLRRRPLDIAEAIRAELVTGEAIASVTTAAPGFLNVRLTPGWLAAQVDAIASAGNDLGRTTTLTGQKIQVEFISANPTGPLTLANARGGPLGDVLANVLALAGATVQREYYFEDTGGQFDMLGRSVIARYRQLFGEDAPIPEEGYPGEYVTGIAERIRERDGDRHLPSKDDALVKIFAAEALIWIEADIRRVAGKFGMRYDTWFKQSEFMASGYFADTMAELRKRGHLIDRDGAAWFDAETLPEDKEGVVVIKSSGEPTYLGKDIAYHRLCLLTRGFDKKIDIWGANTHYHLIKMRSALPALGIALERWEVILYQYVRWLHEGVLKRMGKRLGSVVSLEEVIDTVGVDATRYFLLQSGADRQLDFDFELAVRQSNENPVYYVQYAHARIASIFKTAAERGLSAEGADTSLLTDPGELELAYACVRFPELLAEILEHRGVHLLTGYALELSGLFHAFYRDHRVVTEDEARSRARLRLVQAVQVTLRQTLGLLGISAPEKM